MSIETQPITALCMENYPGYPDPLIYVVEAPLTASPDEIKELVIQERIQELGREQEADVRNYLHVCLAWPGDFQSSTVIFDHRI